MDFDNLRRLFAIFLRKMFKTENGIQFDLKESFNKKFEIDRVWKSKFSNQSHLLRTKIKVSKKKPCQDLINKRIELTNLAILIRSIPDCNIIWKCTELIQDLHDLLPVESHYNCLNILIGWVWLAPPTTLKLPQVSISEERQVTLLILTYIDSLSRVQIFHLQWLVWILSPLPKESRPVHLVIKESPYFRSEK